MNSKISEKDKKIWDEFLSNDQKLPDKDNSQVEIKSQKVRSLDLHGKTLDEANQIIENFIRKSYEDKVLKVTVDFVSEIITCIRDKEKKIVSGSPDKIKTIYDTWTFSRDIGSNNPNWLLVNTLN